MDGLTISTESHIQARWIQQSLEDTVSWAQFNPNKSRCLIIRKGQVTYKFPLHIQEEVIPSLKQTPDKVPRHVI